MASIPQPTAKLCRQYQTWAKYLTPMNKHLLLIRQLSLSFRHDSTRDMAWTLFAPELLNTSNPLPFSIDPSPERLQWLYELDKNPLPVPARQSLGRYYESLWQCFFRQDYRYRHIASNIAVYRQGKTLGELDFVLFDTLHQRHLHLEVAIKFYLHHAQAQDHLHTGNQLWIGPDKRDNLERKWLKLNHAQLALSQQQECSSTLEKIGIHTPLAVAASLKGYLFRTPGDKEQPLHFNTENTLDHYYFCNEFAGMANNQALLGIIPRQRWLSRVHSKASITPVLHDDIIRQVVASNRPVLAGIFTEAGHCYEEQQRFFVVPCGWPGTSA